MAIPLTQVWEVRSDTGLATNGGGFDPSVATPGTDYTYPASNPVAYTDLVIQTTMTNVSSVIRPFVVADVGNTLNITGGTGFTIGRYSIRSVAGNIATLDASAGTASSTGGLGTLGGAIALLSTLTSGTSMTQGNIIWMRDNGSFHDLGSGVTLSFGNVNGGGAGFLFGYSTARNDSGLASLKQTTNLGTTSAINLSGNGYLLRGLIVDGQGTSAGNSSTISSANQGHRFERVKAINASGSGACFLTPGAVFYQCEATGGFGQGISGNNQIYLSYLHDLPKTAASLSQGGSLYRCIVTNIGADAVVGDVPFVTNCTFDNITGSAIRSTNLGSGVSNWQINGNILSRCTGYGIVNGGGLPYNVSNSALTDNNAFYSCTSGNRGGFANVYTNDLSLTQSPFMNIASLDYRLNATPGGGLPCRSAITPAAFPGLPATTNFADLGAVQSSQFNILKLT